MLNTIRPTRLRRISALFLIALLCLLPLATARALTRSPFTIAKADASRASQADVRNLEMGRPVERELAGGESHVYQIQLAAGQYLGAVVEQRGIDVAVTVSAPDGKPLMEVDSP